MLVERTRRLKIGPGNEDDLGPVINAEQLEAMTAAVERARATGAVILTGGRRLVDPAHADGFYMAPTLIENAHSDAEISTREIFGPVTCLYRVRDFTEAMDLANRSPYGLTACIHTRNIHRALEFARRVQAGVAVVMPEPTAASSMPFAALNNPAPVPRTGHRGPGCVLKSQDDLHHLIQIYGIMLDTGY
jgi:aldehyde dehydrogenase (NAD+)